VASWTVAYDPLSRPVGTKKCVREGVHSGVQPGKIMDGVQKNPKEN
jgi:hypothetical protein